MRIIIWYLGDLFISYQCIHIIMILWSYCMCLSSFSLGSATSENHVMPVCYRLLANCKLNLQTRKFANIQFATGTISLSFYHVYYSKNYQHTHVYIDNWSIVSITTSVSICIVQSRRPYASRKKSILGIGIPKIRQVSMLIMIWYIGNSFMSYQCIIL